MQQNLYTPTEIAARLRVSIDTIKRLIKKEKLSASKVGAQWRISEDQLTEYIESRTIKAKKLKIAI